MRRISQTIIAVFGMFLSLTLACSCTASTTGDASESVGSAAESLDADQLSRAAQAAQETMLAGGEVALNAGTYADFSLVEDGSIGVDADGSFIYVTILVATDKVDEGVKAGEAALRLLNAEAYPDDDAGGEWGTLYDTYNVSVHVDNQEGTLDLDAMRAAGADTALQWQ